MACENNTGLTWRQIFGGLSFLSIGNACTLLVIGTQAVKKETVLENMWIDLALGTAMTVFFVGSVFAYKKAKNCCIKSGEFSATSAFFGVNGISQHSEVSPQDVNHESHRMTMV